MRYENRKAHADQRPRVRGRFAKVNSSDSLGTDSASGGAQASEGNDSAAAAAAAAHVAGEGAHVLRPLNRFSRGKCEDGRRGM